MFLNLSSDQFKDFHPQNAPWDFICEIDPPIFLGGRLSVALVDIRWNEDVNENTIHELYVYCDLVDDVNFIDTKFKPVIGIIDQQGKVLLPMYFPVTRDYIHQIRVYIRKRDGKLPTLSSTRLRCTLELKSEP